MIDFLKKTSPSKVVRVYGPFTGSFVVGLTVRVWYPECWRWKDVANALGDAFLVAGVIGLCIEAWTTSILIDHAADELSSRLVGYGLPKAAQELIHKLVHGTKRVYRDYRAVFRIQRHPTKKGYVIVLSTISYVVVNNGTSSESYSPSFAQEGMYTPKVAHLEYGGTALNGDRLTRDVAATGVITFTPPNSHIVLKPSAAAAAIETLSSEQQCSVRWQTSIEMPEYYSDVVAFAGVTVNPVIELIEAPDNIEFHSGGEDCIHESTGQTWLFRRAFITGQHVRVWWKPRQY